MVFASGLSAAPVWQSSSRTLSINSQRPQCPTKHAATPPGGSRKARVHIHGPIRPCVIKCMCSLATCPSLYSFNFAYTSLYISPIPPPFPVVCQMKWLLLSPTPSVVFSYSHLHIHALAVRPASRWDWSTTQRHVLLHVSRRQEPDAMGTYKRTHMCIGTRAM